MKTNETNTAGLAQKVNNEAQMSSRQSLEIIERMIATTKENTGSGEGNFFLMWGYLVTLISVAEYLLLRFTGNNMFTVLFFLIPVIGVPLHVVMLRRSRGPVVTFTDRVIKQASQVLGGAFCVTCVVIPIIGETFAYMIPLSLLYCSFFTSTIGLILRQWAATWLPVLSLGVGVYLLHLMNASETMPLWTILVYALGFVLMMVVPGHVLNYSTRKMEA